MRHHIETLESVAANRVHKPETNRLPLRFANHAMSALAEDAAALPDSERIALAQRFGSVALKIVQPLKSYRGVAIRILEGAREEDDRIAVVLSHSDPAFEVALYEAADDTDVIAEWRKWGTALGLTLLMEGSDGHLVAAEKRLGEVAVEKPCPRRRGSFLARRPRFLNRRRTGKMPLVPLVHYNEREIIAGE